MFTRLAKCSRGAAAVESALLFPIFIVLLLGAIQFGLVLYTYNTMQHATREATRQLAINYLAAGEVPTAIKTKLPSWAAEHASAVVTQTNAADPTTNVFTVTTTLPAAHAAPLDLVPGGSWTLTATVTMKQDQGI